MSHLAAFSDADIPRPDIGEDWLWAWRAWWRLHADRPWIGGGFGPAVPGRIPWGAVRDWCDFHELPGEAVPFLDAVFAELDAVFFDFHKARLPSQ